MKWSSECVDCDCANVQDKDLLSVTTIITLTENDHPLFQRLSSVQTAWKIRAFQGPHTTCLMSAETYSTRHMEQNSGREQSSSKAAKESHQHKTFIYKHFQFIMYFTSGLLFMGGLTLLAILYMFSYFCSRLFWRFQYKLALFFILLQRQPFSFGLVNQMLVEMLQLMLLFIGGFGYLCMLFVEM